MDFLRGHRYRKERLRMVDEQIRRRGVADPRVLSAMAEIPRHEFVPGELRDEAYEDRALPIGFRQTISQPFMVALMTERLAPAPGDRVLEIGTGSGYQAAVLGRLATQVYTVERIPELLIRARKRLESLGIHNVAMKIADGTLGWKDYAPYDAIMVTAGSPDIQKPLLDQLALGGRMIIPVGDENTQVLRKIVKTKFRLVETTHTECTFVKLVGQYGWEEAAGP